MAPEQSSIPAAEFCQGGAPLRATINNKRVDKLKCWLADPLY